MICRFFCTSLFYSFFSNAKAKWSYHLYYLKPQNLQKWLWHLWQRYLTSGATEPDIKKPITPSTTAPQIEPTEIWVNTRAFTSVTMTFITLIIARWASEMWRHRSKHDRIKDYLLFGFFLRTKQTNNQHCHSYES